MIRRTFRGSREKRFSTGVSPVRDKNAIQKRYGANLPHWTKKEGVYSVTFRLGDSLPSQVLKDWEFERTDILTNAKRSKRVFTKWEKEELEFLNSEKVQQYLLAGHGACWLRQDSVAAIVANALQRFDEERYRLFAWCIMPNHVHVVVQPLGKFSLSSILHTWKSFTAKKANAILNRKGTFWQSEYYDHLVRDNDDLTRCIDYVWSNPDQATLQHWKWRWKRSLDKHGQDAHAISTFTLT